MSDPAAAEEFEQGGAVASWTLPFYFVIAAPATAVLIYAAPFTLGLSWFGFIGYQITNFVFQIILILYIFGTPPPAAVLNWMPLNGEEGGAAPADGGDDQ